MMDQLKVSSLCVNILFYNWFDVYTSGIEYLLKFVLTWFMSIKLCKVREDLIFCC